MQIVLDISSRKILPMTAFIITLVKVGFCYFAIGNWETSPFLNGMYEMVRQYSNLAVWVVVAVWFLHIYLYTDKLIERSTLRKVTAFTIFAAMCKYLLSLAIVFLTVKGNVWNSIYTGVEAVIWLVMLAYLMHLLRSVGKQSDNHHHHHHHHHEEEDHYSLKDEIQRKVSGVDPFNIQVKNN